MWLRAPDWSAGCSHDQLDKMPSLHRAIPPVKPVACLGGKATLADGAKPGLRPRIGLLIKKRRGVHFGIAESEELQDFGLERLQRLPIFVGQDAGRSVNREAFTVQV